MTNPTGSSSTRSPQKRKWWLLALAFLLAGALVATFVASMLTSIFEKRQEAQNPYFRVANLDDKTYDPAVWGQNFPLQYQGWLRTQEMPASEQEVQLNPTEKDPQKITAKSKIEHDPRYVTMWQGYAFSVEYNEPRGHAYMLEDQRYVKRVLDFKQPGACLNCHTSLPEVVDTLGNGDAAAGWAKMNKMPYADATQAAKHPVGCIDCHDPQTMKLRVTRPAFIAGIKEYKAGQGIKDYDVNAQATPQEMRTYVCAQCHVEYYFKGEEKTLTFPWDKGLTADAALAYYDEVGFTDFEHKLTGAKVVKAQHPDFETFSQGVHARSGVTCADCHMPYQREGAAKISDHQVASPMRSDESINKSCLTCHNTTEQAMRDRVNIIHDTYEQTKDVAFDALTQLIQDLEVAKSDGTPADRLDKARAYQKKAQFFVDYVVSENSRGFHAPQYTNRLLNDATDAARRGQLVLRGIEYQPAGPAGPQSPQDQPKLAPSKKI